MIILDTNVIAEAMRGPAANRVVLTWLRAQSRQIVTTVINRAEVLAGLAVLPEGRRHGDLLARAEAAFASLGDCLPLLPQHATTYAEIVAVRQVLGRPIAKMHGLMAAIATDNGAAVATRDVGGFDGVGVEVINPWASARS